MSIDEEPDDWKALAWTKVIEARNDERRKTIEECAQIAERYPSSGEQTEHPVEYWIRRLALSSNNSGGAE